MAYFQPYIDSSGMHIPMYNDIRDDLISQMKQIFGSDIYIDNDSQDYQQISIFARKIYDTFCLAQLVYNNRTPITAIGVGLDNISAIANIQRKPATYSKVQLTITGDPGTVIQNGEATDGTNNWVIEGVVTIPSNGNITVEAHSAEAGNFTALPNTITTIATPVFGWISVTNNYSAEPGTNIESDASLRGRFAAATRKTSVTVMDGITASLENIPEVTKVRGWENDTGGVSTGSVPANIPAGLPPHSVTFIVEGGEDIAIANWLFNKKTPGCYTNGTTEVQLTSVTGNTNTIRFYRPTYTDAYFKIKIKKLSTWNDEYLTIIKNNLVTLVEGMAIGDPIYLSTVWSVAAGSTGDVSAPAFSVTGVQLSNNGSTWQDADLTQVFYGLFNTDADKVLLEVS